MSKKCARCDKTVYPTEELKCLDKIWHKPCFKCKECNMALNMRNYKGFNKEPYCEAHIPKAKATTMAETPELRRIAENTKLQSNVTYHAAFEKDKGKFTQVADDPETLRIKQNTKIISNVTYHGEYRRKAEMEQRRQLNENGYVESNQSSVKNQGGGGALGGIGVAGGGGGEGGVVVQQPIQQPPLYQPPPPVSNPSVGKISDYEPGSGQYNSPYSARNSQTLIYSSEVGSVNNPPARHIGSVHDMDPVNHNYGSLGRVYRAMYDYEAQDEDEVSFQDGDLIVNVSSIDGGWMTGEVQRTGHVGMLPANYVQLVNI